MYGRVLAIPLAALLLFPGTQALAGTDWAAANKALVEQQVLPRYRALDEAARALPQPIRALCAAPDLPRLSAAQDGFHRLMDAWQGIGYLTFGPANGAKRRYRFEFWPDQHGTGAKQLRAILTAEDRTLLSPDAFAHTSVGVQGLPALERILFDAPVSPAAFGSDAKASYRCEWAIAIADNLAAMAGDMMRGWETEDPSFAEFVLSANEGNAAFDSAEQAAAMFLRDLRTALQIVSEHKLQPPLGTTNAAGAKPKRAESWRSRRSLKNIHINLQACRDLYETGFAPLLIAAPEGVELDRTIRAVFSEVVRAADAGLVLYESVSDPQRRPQLERLLALVRELEQRVSAEIPEILKLTIGFNALDGD